MIKLIKYEIKDMSRTYISAVLTVFVLNILVLLGYMVIGGGISNFRYSGSGFGFATQGVLGIGIVLCYLVDISMVILAFLFGINIFRKDIYNDSGIMLLTVPRTGIQLVAAKFVTAVLQFIIAFWVSGFFLVMHTIAIQSPLAGKQTSSFISILLDATLKKFDLWIFTTIIALVTFAWVTAAAYLSVAFSKGFLRNKKLRWLATMAVFVGAVVVDSLISRLLEKIIPYTYDATAILFMNKNSIEDGLQLNTATSIFELLVIVAMLVGTAYLVEKKVEL